VSTYYAPLGSLPPGAVSWDVYAGPPYAGHLAVPLVNFGPMWQGSFPFAGVVIEIDPTDPVLPILQPWYTLVLDGMGRSVQPQSFGLPFLPGALGLAIGTEFILLDPQLNVSGSTGAQWMIIVR
jgi:hypothetical protein